MLGCFSYISVSCDFKESKLRQYEPWFHSLILSSSFLLVFIANLRSYINPSGPWCFINRYPSFCEGDECHQNIQFFSLLICFLYIMFFLLASLMMVNVCLTVQKKARIVTALVGKKKVMEENKLKLLHVAKKQSLLFLVCLFFGFGTALVIRVGQTLRNNLTFYELLGSVIMTSSSGILITIVYECTRSKNILALKNNESRSCQRNTTLVSEIRRSIRLADANEDTSNSQQSNELPNQPPSKPTFSIFDGTKESNSPWAAFIFSSEDDSDSDDNKRPPISDSFESEVELQSNHLESEIPAK